jgi:hypothetical protein
VNGYPVSDPAATPVNGQGAELFHVCRLDYPPGGLTAQELAKLRALVGQIVASVAPPAEPQYFVFPGNINPDTWRAVSSAHAVGWQWTTGHSFSMDRPATPKEPGNYKRHLSSLMKAFPSEAQKLQQALADSEAPRGVLTHRLTKTQGYEILFRDRPWVSPIEAFLGTGGFATFCVKDPGAFFSTAAALTGRSGSMSTRGLAFLIPIFTREALAAATRETLRRWFSLFDLYIAEYGYSRGLLVASHQDFSALLEPEFSHFRSAAAGVAGANGAHAD